MYTGTHTQTLPFPFALIAKLSVKMSCVAEYVSKLKCIFKTFPPPHFCSSIVNNYLYSEVGYPQFSVRGSTSFTKCFLNWLDEGMTESPVGTLEKAIVLHIFWTESLIKQGSGSCPLYSPEPQPPPVPHSLGGPGHHQLKCFGYGPGQR